VNSNGSFKGVNIYKPTIISLIDYGMGNLFSVRKALECVGAQVELISDPQSVRNADAVVLPGVGNFGDGMKHLSEQKLKPAIIDFIRQGKPFLGICLGMQALMEESEEAPGVDGLGIFKGKVVRFTDCNLKIPHMGWNQISKRENFFLNGIPDASFFYFVHSFYVVPDDKNIIAAYSDYGIEFAAAIAKNNIFATQFHPEKSQDIGLSILKNFISIARKK
jgi:glutamine amidotransferase